MAAKRDAPELWEQQEGEKSQHYQKFCQYGNGKQKRCKRKHDRWHGRFWLYALQCDRSGH